jgi:RNase H-like domain found in reverse transcriptase
LTCSRKTSFNGPLWLSLPFDQLKLVMTNATVLALPDFSQSFTIETDACKYGIDVVLMQNKRPIA